MFAQGIMNAKSHPISTPQPMDGEFALRTMSHHNLATPYSSSVEGPSTDYNSSRATSYDSPEQSWDMDHCHQGRVNNEHDWSPAMSHHTLPMQRTGSPSHGGNARISLPATRSRTMASARASPSPRKAGGSPNASRVRKVKSAKPGKLATVSMDAPLSILTKDSKVPLKDMESFVNRSTEDRVKEKEKKNGYIVRPMNAFMLYRSAYADRAKGVFDQNNHQIVSKATGMSWKMESKEIHDHYKMLSEIERENHQKAWPDYKFSPSKNNTPARKRKDRQLSDDEGTEQDPTDYDWTPAGSRKPQPSRQSNVRYGPEEAFDASNPGSKMYAYVPRMEYQYPTERPAPMQMDNYPGMDMSYYPEHARMFPHGQVDDARYGRLAHPYHDRMVPIPSGFPRGHHEDLFEMGFMPDHGYLHQGLVDPKLEEYGQVHGHGMFTEDGFADYHGEMLQHVQRTEPGRVHPEDGNGSSILDMLSTDPEGFQKWVQNENQS